MEGEPGIGKTALADEFRRRVGVDDRTTRIARGQCVEGYGSKEAYGPMLDALGRLCRGPEAEVLVRTLLEEAPTWLAQFPALLTRRHREILQREILGATRERMAREIGDALETITANAGLLLVLEDLHWVDDSTVDLISALARRRAPAKLMLLATCRPLAFESAGHSLKALVPDLLIHRLCRKIPLSPLNKAEVEEYLGGNSPECQPPQGLADLVHRHSEGNPLFIVAALEHMGKRSLLSHANGRWQLHVPLEEIELQVPDDLRHMIEAQVERLSAQEQSALELASIAGASFSASMLSTAGDFDLRSLEGLYEELGRRHQMVRWSGIERLPDGGKIECYEFVHVLYRQVLYERQLPGRRARLHREIGERLAAMYSQQMEEAVPRLAYHFEQAADWPRAVEYLQRASDVARRRYAHQQADAMLTRALELVSNLPAGERAQTELQLLTTLAAHRWTSWDVRVVETLETLASRAAEGRLIDVQARALVDLAFFLSFISAERCLEVVRHALELSEMQDQTTRTRTRTSCAFCRLAVNGWNAQNAREFRDGLAELGKKHGIVASDLLDDSRIRWSSGEYREGRRLALEARAILLELGANSNSKMEYEISCAMAPLNLLFLGEWGEALKEYDTAITWAQKNANYHYLQWLRVHQAWLHLQAFDYKSTLALCESARALGRDSTLRTAPGWPIGYPRQVRNALICSASASAALGNHTRALEDFSAARSDMNRQSVLFDWYWRMALAAGLTELWLAMGDRVRARTEAEHFLQISLDTADRHWQGLAWESNARVALADQNYHRARECIGKAVATVQGFEVPLAAWRVHATAADIEEESGNPGSVRFHRDISRSTILQLANSLPEREPLREIFLSAPLVSRILNRHS
jgi:tetratricopeptide (TPR) repeat protein